MKITELRQDGYKYKMCDAISQSGHFANSFKINKLIGNQNTKIQLSKDNVLTFNGHDISDDADFMVQDYIKGDFKTLGFVLGMSLNDAAQKQQNFI